MKNIILIVAGFLAITGSAVISPVTYTAQNSDMAVPNWFRFHGGDINDPSNFSATVNIESCTGGSNLCAILAEPNPLNPARPLMETITERSYHQ